MTDRELDYLVAEKVMGWSFEAAAPNSFEQDFWSESDQYVLPVDYFKPSTEIAAAWKVVEKLCPEEDEFRIERFRRGKWSVTFAHFENDKTRDESLPRTICLAALKAVGVEVEAGERE